MARRPRITAGGLVYHVLNRGNGRMELFSTEAEYVAFEDLLFAARERVAMRVLGYCIMPNHWHLVLWPRGDGDMIEFMRWLAVTHTQRRHLVRGTVGTGHIYQGRYKSFPVQRRRPSAQQRARGVLEGPDPVLSVLRYVERNPLRAGLVGDAAEWRWGSAWRRVHGVAERAGWLTDIPGGLPDDWIAIVNRPQTDEELAALRCCIRRDVPYGTDAWTVALARRHGLDFSLRRAGRLPKAAQQA